MRKPFRPMLALVVAGALTLAGCGNTGGQPAQNTAEQTNQAAGQQSSDNLASHVQQMLNTATQLKDVIKKKDDKQIAALGPRLEDEWKTFEDDVRPKYPDQYESVEKSLDPLVAGSTASPVDTATLSKLDEDLIEALNDLANAVKGAK